MSIFPDEDSEIRIPTMSRHQTAAIPTMSPEEIQDVETGH